jgi:hypothetical protein
MAGELAVESDGVGRGATFSLSLPRWKEDAPGAKPANSLAVKTPDECFAPSKPAKPI